MDYLWLAIGQDAVSSFYIFRQEGSAYDKLQSYNDCISVNNADNPNN